MKYLSFYKKKKKATGNSWAVWIKPPFGYEEVEERFPSKPEAETYAENLQKKNPDWEVWVMSDKDRNWFEENFEEAF